MATVSFTVRYLDSLKPQPKRYEVRHARAGAGDPRYAGRA